MIHATGFLDAFALRSAWHRGPGTWCIEDSNGYLLYLQQMGYLLAPFGIAYRVHGAQFNTITDTEFLKSDPLVIQRVKGMTTNVIEMIRLDPEAKLKGNLVRSAGPVRSGILFFDPDPRHRHDLRTGKNRLNNRWVEDRRRGDGPPPSFPAYSGIW